jgi:uncharacterized protein (DUF302 family)
MLAVKKELTVGFEEARGLVERALGAEGFGVLTRIDVKATFAAKLGVDFRRYEILGACNPSFAHAALSTDLQAGLAMPCNVVLYETDEGKVHVLAVDPTATVAVAGNPDLATLAVSVKEKLVRALSSIP